MDNEFEEQMIYDPVLGKVVVELIPVVKKNLVPAEPVDEEEEKPKKRVRKKTKTYEEEQEEYVDDSDYSGSKPKKKKKNKKTSPSSSSHKHRGKLAELRVEMLDVVYEGEQSLGEFAQSFPSKVFSEVLQSWKAPTTEAD